MESWFVPVDIMMIVVLLFTILLSLTFLLIIIFDKTCRTIPMLFVANSCLAHFLLGFNLFGNRIFALYNDWKQMQYPDPFCYFRGYLGYASLTVLNCSFVIQALYRYFSVVYPARLFWKSKRNQFFLVCLTWVVGFVQPIHTILRSDEIVYNIDNQICQAPVGLFFTIVYLAFTIYLLPNIAMGIIYFKLVWHVRQMSKRVAPANLLFHARRELVMVRRAVMIISILVALGFPYLVFLIQSFFTGIHKYHFRIIYIFIDISMAMVIIILFQFTEPLKIAVMKRLRRRVVTVVPTVT